MLQQRADALDSFVRVSRVSNLTLANDIVDYL